jgi:GntR family transcriptional regulator/MocR family aminotransferase
MEKERTTSSPELLLRIDRRAGMPLRTQLEQELRAAVRTGRLVAGAELPSSRLLAAELGVSRGLVVEAYEQLLAEGYLTARHGSATVIALRMPDVQRAAPIEAADAPLRYDFRPGVPDSKLFPRRAWLLSLRRVLNDMHSGALHYPDVRGVSPVRVALAAYLNRARGTRALPERMVMCTGFTQGFNLACKALARCGVKSVAMEEPTHQEQRAIIRAAGLNPVTIGVDEYGLVVDRLKRSDAGAVFVTPAHQFPTGAVLAPERRTALLEWARDRSAIVIEDDYDAEFRYDREPIGALQGIAPENVVYIGSASKTLAPALRLGWMALPERLANEVARLKRLEDMGSPALDQFTLADFLERGELDRHLRRMRLHYRRRRDALMTALRARLPQLPVSGVAAGLHLMLELPPDADEQAVVAKAAELSVRVIGVGSYRARSKARPALVLGYGAIEDLLMEEGVKRLASAIGRGGQ